MFTFGERLAKLRTDHGYSQKALADQLTLSKSSLAMYEKNNRQPNFEIIIKIADWFDVSVDYLLVRTDEPHFTKSEARPVSLEMTLNQLHQGLREGKFTVGGQPLPEQMKKFVLAPLEAIRSIVNTFLEQQHTVSE